MVTLQSYMLIRIPFKKLKYSEDLKSGLVWILSGQSFFKGSPYSLYDLQLNTNEHDSSIYRDLTTVYTNDNWFVILLSRVYFGD